MIEIIHRTSLIACSWSMDNFYEFLLINFSKSSKIPLNYSREIYEYIKYIVMEFLLVKFVFIAHYIWKFHLFWELQYFEKKVQSISIISDHLKGTWGSFVANFGGVQLYMICIMNIQKKL